MLVHPRFRPDRRKPAGSTEYDVWKTLRGLKYTVEIAAVEHDLRLLDRQLAEFRPDIVFNLLEEFRGEGVYDFHTVTFLEALGIPYTGCNPRGLAVTRNKLWATHIAGACGWPVPESHPLKGRPAPGRFPALVKFTREHASLGITQANVVRTAGELRRSVGRMRRRHDGEVMVQSFIAGQEVTVAVWGNQKGEAFVPWRLHLRRPTDIATSKVKFDARYRHRRGIRAARFQGELSQALRRSSERLFVALDMNGYARFDYRVDAENTPYLIDVNANPNLARDEDFACSARRCGYDYGAVIERILALGLSYQPRL